MTTYETETGLEFGETGEFAELGESEDEQFLGNVLGGLVGGGEVVSPLSEAQEIQLASELLEISSEDELEQFLGSLIKKVGGFVKGPIGQALGGVLKSVAKRALPLVGGALGSFVPGIGTAIGTKLGSMASGLFEMELESMPQEQAEFEVARRIVGLTAAAARTAAQARPRPGASPSTIARAAIATAARAYAPGLQRQMLQALKSSAGQSGAARRPGNGMGRPYGPRPGPGRNGGYGTPWYGGVPGVTYVADASDGGAEPYDESFDPGHASGGVGTSGRWVRRGRRIVLFGA